MNGEQDKKTPSNATVSEEEYLERRSISQNPVPVDDKVWTAGMKALLVGGGVALLTNLGNSSGVIDLGPAVVTGLLSYGYFKLNDRTKEIANDLKNIVRMYKQHCFPDKNQQPSPPKNDHPKIL
ncbi:MAG: hypothetical protein ACOY3I_04085 [Verrucomicrobiota bacterium]